VRISESVFRTSRGQTAADIEAESTDVVSMTFPRGYSGTDVRFHISFVVYFDINPKSISGLEEDQQNEVKMPQSVQARSRLRYL